MCHACMVQDAGYVMQLGRLGRAEEGKEITYDSLVFCFGFLLWCVSGSEVLLVWNEMGGDGMQFHGMAFLTALARV